MPSEFSLLQKLQSYLIDVLIERRTSTFDDDLFLILRRGKLQLCTANAVYSYEDRYYNFAGLFTDWMDLSELDGKKILILGLGLGSVPQLIENHDPGNWQFTAVEIDEAVCELAGTYSVPRISSTMEIVVADAAAFMALNTRSFDLICMDVFVDDKVPPIFKKDEFLLDCQRSLEAGGLVVYNAPAFDHLDRDESRSFYRRFNRVFPDACMLEIHRNFMMLSNRRYLKRDIL